MRSGASELRQPGGVCVSLPLRDIYCISLSVFHFHLCSLPSQVFSSPSSRLHLTVCLSICLRREAAERGGGIEGGGL